MSLPLFFTISGPSGVGKSTAFRELLHQAFPFDLAVPQKITTRAEKVSDTQGEFLFLSDAAFDKEEAQARLLVSYVRHGHRYGILKPQVTDRNVFLQIVPSAVAVDMKALNAQDYRFVLLRLVASEATIRARLTGRADPVSEAEIKSRQKTATNPTSDQADVYIDAERPPLQIAADIAEKMRQIFAQNP